MKDTPAILAATLALAVLVSAALLRSAFLVWKPPHLLRAGRFVEARRAAERLERSWLRVLPGIRLTSQWTLACALHFEGDLEGSLARIAELASKLPPAVRDSSAVMEAANLVLLDRDADRAATLLATARSPEDLLLRALATARAGRPDEADRLYRAAGKTHPSPQRHQAAMFHFLRGAYLVEVGRALEAEGDLARAANGHQHDTVYVARARALLDATAPSPDEEPSSLAPQTVERG